MADTTTDKTKAPAYTGKKIDLKAMWSSLPTPIKWGVGIGAAYLLIVIAGKLVSASADLKASVSKFKTAGAKPPTLNY